jgi:toxin ParE1/3/4
MARYRITTHARADIEGLLEVSLEHWGEDGQARYESLIEDGLRTIAGAPMGVATRTRTELGSGIRSMHLRSLRKGRGVKDPVHVIFYRVDEDLVEIVRVLHERTEPARHLPPARKRR